MPRHHRERILEYTKTVTVTEVVNNSAHCHPGTCEVTVTNIDSGSGHPVSVNISHLHEQTIDEGSGSGRCSPVVHVRETIKENTPTDSVEKINSCVERILRVQTEGDVTFKRRRDNVVDLSFTTPVKPVNYSKLTNPDTTLYYHSFKKEISKETANDLISPDSAVSESSKRYMRSDDSDSDSGSLIIHSPVARPDSGVSSSNQRVPNGKNLSSISVGSSEDDLIYQGPSYNHKDLKDDRLPYYIVTSKAETHNSQQSPNTTTFFADLDTSGTTTTTVGMNDSRETHTEVHHPHRYQKRGPREREKRRSILVVTSVSATPSEDRESTEDVTDSDWNDSLPKDKRRRITMEVLFTPPTPNENGAPPKPPRRAKYDRPQLVEHVQHYECSLDEMSKGPKMTSTPISTLERQTRRSTDDLGGNVTEKIEDKQSETPVLSPRKSSKPPALKSLQPETPERKSLSSPRRSPSSPIIVVDQERKSSMDLLVPPKQPRRKSTITDIDWFAAFNMKEPTTPKSPRSPMVVDALREVENAVIEKRRPRSLRQEKRDAKPLSPAKIDLNDVFSYSQPATEEAKDDNCPCNACVLMKMSPEEAKRRFNAHKRGSQAGNQNLHHHQHHQEVKLPLHYVDSDISLDDVFAPKPRKVEDHRDYYNEEPVKERDASSVHSANMHDSIFVFPSSADTFNSHNQRKSHSQDYSRSEISLEDVFESKSSVKPHGEATLNTDIDHHKTATEATYSISRSPREIIELHVTATDPNNAGNLKQEASSSPETTDRNISKSASALKEIIAVVPKEPKKDLQKSSSGKDTKMVEKERKDHEMPYVPSEISLDDVFTSKTELSPEPKTSEDPAEQNEEDQPSPRPQRPERRKKEKTEQEHRQHTESDISLDDVFSVQSTSFKEPAQKMLTKFDSKKKAAAHKAEERTSDSKTDLKNKEDVLFSPATSLSLLKPTPSTTEGKKNDGKQADIGYTASDISLDDVFSTKSTTDGKQSRKVESKIDSNDPRLAAVTRRQSDTKMGDVVKPLKPQKVENERHSGSSLEDHDKPSKIEKRPTEREEIQEESENALEGVNWLDELLTQNHQPKEEDLKQTVKQLYEKVVPSPSNSFSCTVNLNDTMESGYTSLDRTRGRASHDVSMSDSYPDLDKVFNPISSDRKRAGETKLAPDQSSSSVAKDQSRGSDRSKGSQGSTVEIKSDSAVQEKQSEQHYHAEQESRDDEYVIESEEYHDYRNETQMSNISSESKSHEYHSVSHGRTGSEDKLDWKGSEKAQQAEQDNGRTAPVEINLDDIFTQPSSSHGNNRSQNHKAKEGEVESSTTDIQNEASSYVNITERPIDFQAPSKDEAYYMEEIKNNEDIAEWTPAADINLDEVFNPDNKQKKSLSDNHGEMHVVDSEEHKRYYKQKPVHSESRRLSQSVPQLSSYHNTETRETDQEKSWEKDDSSWIESIITTATIEEPKKKDKDAEDINLLDVFDKMPEPVNEKTEPRMEAGSLPVKNRSSEHLGASQLPEQKLAKPAVEEGAALAAKHNTKEFSPTKADKEKKHDNEHNKEETAGSSTVEQMRWIEQLINSSKENVKKRKEEKKEQNNPDEEPVNVDDLLKEVFDTPCDSDEKGDNCNCSACRVTKMSQEELQEFVKQIKEKENKASITEEDIERKTVEEEDDRPKRADGSVDLDDVFAVAGLEGKNKRERQDDAKESNDHETKEEKHSKRKHSREKRNDKPVVGQKDDATIEPSMEKTAAFDFEEIFFPGRKKETEEEREEKEERQWLATVIDKTEKELEAKERKYNEDAPIEINLDDVFDSKSKATNVMPIEKTVEKKTRNDRTEEDFGRTPKRVYDKGHQSQADQPSTSEPTIVHAEEQNKYSSSNLEDVFAAASKDAFKEEETLKGRKQEKRSTSSGTEHHETSKKGLAAKGDAEKPRTSSEDHTDEQKHDDHWIHDVMKSNGQDDDEADTFEASFLQSIKEENKKQKTDYDDYYREESEPAKKSGERRHLDDYYDEPDEDEEGVEDIDIADLVNDILSSSLNEAAFKVATTGGNRDSRRTDTSADKTRDNHPSSEMYVSTTASDNRMESILSYPPSVASPVTPHTTDPGAKFVSEASMTLSNAQDDDYIIRLVFANQKGEELLEQQSSDQPTKDDRVMTESEVASRSNSYFEFPSYSSYETRETRATEQPSWSSQRSMGKTDEEFLEVEVNQKNFVIKGNYTIVINKDDPLGVLLSELTAGSKALDFSVTPKIRRLLLQCLKEKAKPNIGKSLSSRAKDILTSNDYAYDVFYAMNSNQYSKNNRSGNINFCTAENNVCNELVEQRFRHNPNLFLPDYQHLMHYGPPGGYPENRRKLCDYLRGAYSQDVDENNMVLLPSGNATYDLVCHCLFESEDILLTNAPTYSRNFINVSTRAQCQLVCVNFDLSNVHIDLKEYDRVFEERCDNGDNVRAVVIINPNNPLGTVFSLDDLKKLAHWAEEKNLWLIVDESFSQCIHDKNTTFDSFLKIQMSLPVKSVWFWSLSKDFGLPGVKLSIVHTNDRDLHHALSQLELTGPVSMLAQDFVANFLTDQEWLEKFKKDKLGRLQAHYNFVTENLKNLDIPYLPAAAGIFVFVDFSKKLQSRTPEGEDELFKELTSRGIYMTPGSHTRCYLPGWMRLVFSCEKDQLKEGFQRLYELYGSHKTIVGEINY